MRIRLAKLVSWGFVSMLSAAASTAQAQSPPIIGPAGTWNGQWSSPSGYIYDARMQLEIDSGGTIQGQIHWTLQKSPAAEEQAKLGMTGEELVRGNYDPASRVLTFDGYDKTDSRGILGLDKYRLLLADNANVLGGITWDHGSWRGVFNLTRAGTESSSANSVPVLASPDLVVTDTQDYESHEAHFRRYKYAIDSSADYPVERFATVPELPHYGLNTEVSRSWVESATLKNIAVAPTLCRIRLGS